jgi:mono/diheme cytochrome c family protein
MRRVNLPVACVLVVMLGGCGGSSTASKATPQQVERVTLSTPFNTGGRTALSVEPPPAVTHASGARLAEFDLGRTVTAQSGCLACHRIAGQGHTSPGPDLTYVGSMLSPRNIERSIISPTEPMPSFKHLPEAKFKALVVFLSLLGRH